MDWEKDCKRCGLCCTYSFCDSVTIDNDRFEKWYRPIDLVCIFLNDNNECSIYDKRKLIMRCNSPDNTPIERRPISCVFGGKATTIDNDMFYNLVPDDLYEHLKTGVFKWR